MDSELETIPPGEVVVPRDEEGALAAACREGNLQRVQALLSLTGDAAVDVHVHDEYAFQQACLYGHLAVVRELLALTGERRVNVHVSEETPFRDACWGGHVDVIRELLALQDDRYVKVSALDDLAFAWACRAGRMEVVRLLLDLNGDRRIQSQYTLSQGAHIASRHGLLDLLGVIFGLTGDQRFADSRGAYLTACQHGQVDIVRELLRLEDDRRVDVCADDALGFALACGSGNAELVRLLLSLEGDRRIDVHAACQASCFRSAFDEACSAGQMDVLRELLSLSGDRRIESGEVLRRGMQKACTAGRPAVVRELLALTDERALEFTKGDMESWLHGALVTDSAEVLQLFLGLTPERSASAPDYALSSRFLKSACYCGSISIVRELMQRGADINADEDAAFRTACKATKNNAMLRFLLGLEGDQRVDVHACNDKAFRDVCTFNTKDNLQLLLELPPERGFDWDSEGHQALLRAVYPRGLQDRGSWVKVHNVLPFPTDWIRILVDSMAAKYTGPSYECPPQLRQGWAAPVPDPASAQLAFRVYFGLTIARDQGYCSEALLPRAHWYKSALALACVLPGLRNEGARSVMLQDPALGNYKGGRYVRAIAEKFGSPLRQYARDVAWRGVAIPLYTPPDPRPKLDECEMLCRVARSRMVLHRASQLSEQEEPHV